MAAQTASEIRMYDYLQILSISLMYWDWLITLDDEIGLMWKRARSASAYWFFAVRYAGLAGNIPVAVFTFFAIPAKVCQSYHTGHQLVLVVTQLIVSLVMLVRIHALYERNVRLLVSLILISSPLLAIIIWSVHDQSSEPLLGFPGCQNIMSESNSYHLAGAWFCLFGFDALMFGLTVFKTYSTWRRTGSESDHLPIHNLLLLDGALYFGAMALANFSNIITFYLARPVLSGSLSTFASCMSVTLMARLMLNLHKTAAAASASGGLADLDLSLQSQPVFRAQRETVLPDGDGDGERPLDISASRLRARGEMSPETQRSYIPP
ncbi:hypothetical protein C8R47DRAFT_1141710 [Mycena vitilis]|nr:hypothetical protein C8R47DRAFT_1141710 [Mycena vitilis]